jgi:hypothetical protein
LPTLILFVRKCNGKVAAFDNVRLDGFTIEEADELGDKAGNGGANFECDVESSAQRNLQSISERKRK